MQFDPSQSNLFEQHSQRFDLPDADIQFTTGFLSATECQHYFARLENSINWRQDELVIFGRKVLAPRLTYWVGDDWMTYSYSNHTLKPNPWTAELNALKQKVEASSGDTFNSVLVNFYRDGQDSNGWHSDDEKELGPNPVIASLSLGGSRDFLLRHKIDKSKKAKVNLVPGSLLMMRGTTQAFWQHQIPKRANAEPRINLTFRRIVKS